MHGDEFYMQRAYELALKSYREGGCPIGAVLKSSDSGEILGQGHNCLIQEGNPILHGEMAALRDAGRMINRHNTTLYTTLVPCFMCAGTIVQFGIPRLVIADVVNTTDRDTVDFLLEHLVKISFMDPELSPSTKNCIELVSRFKQEKPLQWLEDWGGGPNPYLKLAEKYS